MSEVTVRTVAELEALRQQVSKELRTLREAKKREAKSPVRLGATKSGDAALLVSPPGRRGAPTRITRDVAEVIFSADWAEVAASFASGEELDPALFASDEPEEDGEEESSDED